MTAKSRIASILNTNNLDKSITGFQGFSLSELQLDSAIDFKLPTNLRLGHLVEKIVSELIKASTNFTVRYENTQLAEDKRTIGEIDFIIEENETKQLIHMELAYKFYLFDPSISTKEINNWIGPNRKDSLKEKLEKLSVKQFPLLYHHCAKAMFDNIKIEEVSQALCFLVSLFVPYEYKANVDPEYQKSIKGYYLSIETFNNIDHLEKRYCIPSKSQWGMDPSENETWKNVNGIEQQLAQCMEEKQAPLCWQKNGNMYESFFIVWW